VELRAGRDAAVVRDFWVSHVLSSLQDKITVHDANIYKAYTASYYKVMYDMYHKLPAEVRERIEADYATVLKRE